MEYCMYSFLSCFPTRFITTHVRLARQSKRLSRSNPAQAHVPRTSTHDVVRVPCIHLICRLTLRTCMAARLGRAAVAWALRWQSRQMDGARLSSGLGRGVSPGRAAAESGETHPKCIGHPAASARRDRWPRPCRHVIRDRRGVARRRQSASTPSLFVSCQRMVGRRYFGSARPIMNSVTQISRRRGWARTTGELCRACQRRSAQIRLKRTLPKTAECQWDGGLIAWESYFCGVTCCRQSEMLDTTRPCRTVTKLTTWYEAIGGANK